MSSSIDFCFRVTRQVFCRTYKNSIFSYVCRPDAWVEKGCNADNDPYLDMHDNCLLLFHQKLRNCRDCICQHSLNLCRCSRHALSSRVWSGPGYSCRSFDVNWTLGGLHRSYNFSLPTSSCSFKRHSGLHQQDVSLLFGSEFLDSDSVLKALLGRCFNLQFQLFSVSCHCISPLPIQPESSSQPSV